MKEKFKFGPYFRYRPREFEDHEKKDAEQNKTREQKPDKQNRPGSSKYRNKRRRARRRAKAGKKIPDDETRRLHQNILRSFLKKLFYGKEIKIKDHYIKMINCKFVQLIIELYKCIGH